MDDVLLGGPGLRRGRRDPEAVGYGEVFDFWRVVGLDQDRRLALRAQMLLPGEALLEFRVEPSSEGTCVMPKLRFSSRFGLFGLAYWYAVVPLHDIVFSGMILGIQREALQIAARDADIKTQEDK